jgi:hypothetical protein
VILVQIVLFSLVVYRVTRFLLLDTLIENVRESWLIWLEKPKIQGGKMGLWREKLLQLSSCPYCVSIWVSAGTVALTMIWTSVPLPVWQWLAASAGSLVVYTYVDSEDEDK